MSGPKSSRYTLTRQQQLLLLQRMRQEQERLIELERRKSKLEIVKHMCRQLRWSTSELQAVLKQMETAASKVPAVVPTLSTARNLYQRMIDEITQAEKLGTSSTLDQLEQIRSSILILIREAQEENQRLRDFADKLDIFIRDEATKGFISGFELSFANLSKRKAKADCVKEQQTIGYYFSKIQSEMHKLVGLTISEQQKKKLEEIKKRADDIESPDYLENFLAISVIPFVKECMEYDRLYQKNGDDYEQLRLRYEYLAKNMGYQVEPVMFSAQAVTILLEKIAVLESEALQKQEDEYICQCIDEAMADMNYSVIGSRNVTKKSGKQFASVLYRFDEGIAVNVTYASDGKITMELGGTSHVDRVPTEEEGHSLEEDMQVFCDDFSEIEKKLKAKGIEAKRISHLPADAQFAQIINVSDYQMTDNIDEFNANVGKRRRTGMVSSFFRKEG